MKMAKYEVFDYDIDVWGKGAEDYRIYDVIPAGIIINTDDTSKSSICEKLGLYAQYNDQDKLETCFNKYTGVIYVYYNMRPLCELHAVK